MDDDSDITVSPILEALYQGRMDDARALLAKQPELDVFEAAATGSTDRLAALLRDDPTRATSWSPDGFTPLHLAAFFGHRDAVALLVEHGADVEVVSRHELVRVTPLHSAVAGEGAADPGTVEELLRRAAPVNAKVEGGHTPLHSAAQNGDAAMARLLLAHGADAAAARDDGKTALDLAREGGHDEVAGLLEG
jgi:uncharacterized protein